MSLKATDSNITSFGVVKDDSAHSNVSCKRAVGGPSSSEEYSFKFLRRQVAAPSPQEPVTRKRSFSASSVSNTSISSILSASGTEPAKASLSKSQVDTSGRIFPSGVTATARPLSASFTTPSSKLAEWSGCGTTTRSNSSQSCRAPRPQTAEFTLKAELGEKKHCPVPGETKGTLFSLLKGDGSAPSTRTRPLIRLRENCKALVDENPAKPVRRLRKPSQFPLKSNLSLLS